MKQCHRNRTQFLLAAWASLSLSAVAAELTPVGPNFATDLFLWTDTCNVYVVRDGEAALLIDLGDGSVLDHLKDIGVKRVEWVLFKGNRTHADLP